MKIIYLSHFRLPTAKAHGLQVMKMCESFAGTGSKVELLIPTKKNFIGQNPFDYYGVKNSFSLRRLYIPDLGSRTTRFGVILFWLDFLSFATAIFFSGLSRDEEAIYYTRDYPLLFLFPGWRKSSLVVEIHDIPLRRRFLFKRSLKLATHIVAVTQGVKNELVKMGVPSQKIVVAPDSVDLEAFNTKVDKSSARKKLEIDQEAYVAMYIGKLGDWKGTETLFKTSTSLYPEVKIVAIGGDPEEIPPLQKKYPEVIFKGFLPYRELPENQKAADVLVVPNTGKTAISKYYTSPLKLFAHMASGVPIIASDLPSLREILSEDNAFFFTADDPESLKEIILKVKSNMNEAKNRARRAQEDVLRYTWDRRVRLIVDFLTAKGN
ncbi:MAG: glycosyltransferase family 4 protein [bacterium]|nr:glycosyltransferase family 4 protein [bacterium]